MTTGQPAPPAPGNRPSQRVLVIIPTFNERENLPVIHRRLTQACPAVHVLVVDTAAPTAPASSPTSWRRPIPAAPT